MLTGQLVIIQTSSLSFRRPKIVKSDSKEVDLSRYVISGTGTAHKSGVRSEVWAGRGFSTQEGTRFTPDLPETLMPGSLQAWPWSPNAYIFVMLCRVSSEKAMAPHSSTLAWKIPWTEEPGRLQSMGSLSQTRLSDFTFTFHFHALEKEMVTHSSVLAWKIPGMGEPGGLQSMGLQRVEHD